MPVDTLLRPQTEVKLAVQRSTEHRQLLLFSPKASLKGLVEKHRKEVGGDGRRQWMRAFSKSGQGEKQLEEWRRKQHPRIGTGVGKGPGVARAEAGACLSWSQRLSFGVGLTPGINQSSGLNNCSLPNAGRRATGSWPGSLVQKPDFSSPNKSSKLLGAFRVGRGSPRNSSVGPAPGNPHPWTGHSRQPLYLGERPVKETELAGITK